MDEHTIKLTTDEVESLRELLDAQHNTLNPYRQGGDLLDAIRWKIGVIREEPRDPDVDERFNKRG